ncbi:MAG: ABC transporter ATP-binding protein [Phycisphaerales bacterium]
MSQYFAEDEQYKGQLDFALWKRIAAHTLPYRWHIALLCTAGLIVAAIDTLFPYITGLLIDEAIANGATRHMWVLIILFAALSTLLATGVWIFIVLAGRIATGIAADLRKQSFDKLQELSFSYYDVRPTGWLLSRLTSDCHKLSSLVPWFMLDLVWGTAMVLGITLAMLLLSWKLALAVLAIVPPLAIITWMFQVKLLESSRLVRKTNSQMTASFNEAIMGVRTTKTLVREEANLGEFQQLSGNMFRYAMRNALQSAAYLPMVVALGSIGAGLALWRGGVLIDGSSGLTLGTLIAFMQYAALFYIPIQDLAARFTQLQSAQAAAERVQSLLDETPAIRDSDDVRAQIAAVGEDGRNATGSVDGGDEVIQTIEFRDVSFAYKEDEPVLREFNLTVSAGETIALVGATGGGKSTIVSLLARFYEPTSGEILMNGVDYRKRSLSWLQGNLGVVLQTPHLFSGSIRDNIRYGRLDATDAEIEAAARTANAHVFIAELADGYKHEVGESGGNLSMGQRQLIALARAILADPQIFIMDEATSSVDTETEALIQEGIDHVLADRTAFVIAHRLSTIRRADQILLIERGRIVEHGDHQTLIRLRGKYHALYTGQFAREHEQDAFADSTA